MVSSYSKQIFEKIFDEAMCKDIKTFSKEISNSDADVFIVMARKAACFIRFLRNCGFIDIGGIIVTDRVLDIDVTWLQNKKVAIIDDVIVSGTTIYNVIEKVKEAKPSSIEVLVLGVTDICNKSIFDYVDTDGKLNNYIRSPYVLLTEAGCIRTCSNIVTTFSLDISQYDVDFPRHECIYLNKYTFNKILTHYTWKTYDVSSFIQSNNDVLNYTLIPTDEVLTAFDQAAGFPVSQMGFCKIRVMARRSEQKSKEIIINAVPFFLFDAIGENDVDLLYDSFFKNKIAIKLKTQAKIRLLQYVLAEKLFNIWIKNIERNLGKTIKVEISKESFGLIFPRSFWGHVIEAINTSVRYEHRGTYSENAIKVYKNEKQFESTLLVSDEERDNMALIQSKLIEPFTSLYHSEEKNARQIVIQYGKEAFNMSQYKKLIDRLNHGYSYQKLISLLSDFPDNYDKNTMVSLFLDEAIDAGIVVPIVSREELTTKGKEKYVYFRAYRHGEDVPFGEEEEKKCAILLKKLYQLAGEKILTKMKVEKMLVLFLKIGVSQNLFSYNSGEEILYKTSVGSYLHGNVAITEHPSIQRTELYMKHKDEAVWLTDKLVNKGILILNNGRAGDEDQELSEEQDLIECQERQEERVKGEEIVKYKSVEDPIDLPIDNDISGKIEAIGIVFGMLFKNKGNEGFPKLSDRDLIYLSTCMYPVDIINALAAELAICNDRWKRLTKDHYSLEQIPSKYRNDKLYISVNSGQMKFFAFMEKKAIKLVRTIGEKFNSNSNTAIYASVWKQLWPGNIDWDNNSLGESTRMLINRLGQCLIWYNILFRLLFAVCYDDKVKSKELLDQAKDYCSPEKLFYKGFNNDKLSGNIDYQVNIMSDDLEEGKSLRVYYDNVFNAINWVTVKRSSPLLDEIDLFVDRHGKIKEVLHFGHVIYFKFYDVSDNWLHEYANQLSLLVQNKKIECRVEPQYVDGDLPKGVWIFLRISEAKNIQKIVNHVLQSPMVFKQIYVFLGLSDALKIKTREDGNTKYKYGLFVSYFREIEDYVDTSTGENNSVIMVQNQPNSRGAKEGITFPQNYKRLWSRKYELESLFHDEVSVKVYCKKGEKTMLRDWYNKRLGRPMSVFLSYTLSEETTKENVDAIVRHLEKSKIETLYYEQLPLGTDLTAYMRNIYKCDFVLILGSKKYKEKAENSDFDDTGVSFEDRLIAGIFKSVDRNKIIPASVGKFSETIPAPYDTMRGYQFKYYSEEELDGFVEALLYAFKEKNCPNEDIDI